MVAKQSVVIVSLGCNKNLVDSEVMAGILSEKGYELVASPSEANIGIVNTCGFIESAKQESVDAILDLVDYAQSEQRPFVLIVAGCLKPEVR